MQHATGEADDVRRASGGDAVAFRRLYEAHVGRVHALALRMAGPEVAEDLTQEVFIRAWERLHTFRGEARFGTWLHRLAVHYLLSARKRRRRREDRQVSGEGILDRTAAPPGRSTAVVLDLEAAIRTLPEGARDVFVLYDVEGYRHKEIAELMGISVGTSKSQLHRARMLLRRHLNGGPR